MLGSDDVVGMLTGREEPVAAESERVETLGGRHGNGPDINGPGRGIQRENSIEEEEEEGLMMARSPPRAKELGLGIGGVF